MIESHFGNTWEGYLRKYFIKQCQKVMIPSCLHLILLYGSVWIPFFAGSHWQSHFQKKKEKSKMAYHGGGPRNIVKNPRNT